MGEREFWIEEEEVSRGDGNKILPGFRFYPTDQELVMFYLRRKLQGKKLPVDIIQTIDLYSYDPWELPARGRVGENEWFFFVPRDSRNCNGVRPKRITKTGYWKATGCDRSVHECSSCIGVKKILVFYLGRARTNQKTNWVMNEYRLIYPAISGGQPTKRNPKEEITLCRIRHKVDPLRRHVDVEGSSRSLLIKEKSGSVSAISSSLFTPESLAEAEEVSCAKLLSHFPKETSWPKSPNENSEEEDYVAKNQSWIFSNKKSSWSRDDLDAGVLQDDMLNIAGKPMSQHSNRALDAASSMSSCSVDDSYKAACHRISNKLSSNSPTSLQVSNPFSDVRFLSSIAEQEIPWKEEFGVWSPKVW